MSFFFKKKETHTKVLSGKWAPCLLLILKWCKKNTHTQVYMGGRQAEALENLIEEYVDSLSIIFSTFL